MKIISRKSYLIYEDNYQAFKKYVFFHFFQKYFADEKPTWSSGSGNINVDQSVAQYTGGLVKIDKDLSNASLGPTPMPELAHLSIGNLISFF